MAILTNTALTFSAVGNREDLADIIYNVDITKQPFQAAIGKTSASAVLHEWQTEVLANAAANAQIEGDDTTSSYTFGAANWPTRVSNRCQISMKDAVVSGTQDAVNKAGRNREIVRQLTIRGKELRRDMEFVLTNNQAPVTGDSTTARQLRPLVSWYSTNTVANGGSNGSSSAARTDGTQRALTEALLKSGIQSVAGNGGDINLIMTGLFNKTVISGFSGNTTRMQDTSGGRLDTAIDVYKSDFGVHNIKWNAFQRARDVHLLDTSLLAVAYLRPFQTIDLAKTGDNEKGRMQAEYTLEVRNERGLGLVADLTTS